MPFAPMPLLAPGAPLAVVAPSGPFDAEKFEKGLAVLASRYRPEVAPEARAAHRYLAGPDAARLGALRRCFESDVSAVMAARGGYGAMRLLSHLELRRPLTLLGFSDVTALHLAWLAKGFRTIHGPVVTQLGTQPAEVVERTFALLEGRPVAPLEATTTIVTGVAQGPLIGGNLSLLASLAATPFFPSLEGAVLLLEDVGERPYRLDRMWTTLRLSGVLARVAGVALGEFTDCEEKGAGYSSAEVLAELTADLGVPVVAGLPIGHGAVNQPVVLGARVRLDATAKRLEFLEGLR